MEIISRSQAELLGKKFYFSGVPCLRGHISKRYVSAKTCHTCISQRHNKKEAAQYYLDNREKLIARVNRYRKANPEKIKASKARYR